MRNFNPVRYQPGLKVCMIDKNLKGKCIDFSSRAQMKDNWISVPMVSLACVRQGKLAISPIS